MESVKISSKYQLVIPRAVRERQRLRPGMRLTVIDRDGVIMLVRERPMREYRGIAKGADISGLREKKDRF